MFIKTGKWKHTWWNETEWPQWLQWHKLFPIKQMSDIQMHSIRSSVVTWWMFFMFFWHFIDKTIQSMNWENNGLINDESISWMQSCCPPDCSWHFVPEPLPPSSSTLLISVTFGSHARLGFCVLISAQIISLEPHHNALTVTELECLVWSKCAALWKLHGSNLNGKLLKITHFRTVLNYWRIDILHASLLVLFLHTSMTLASGGSSHTNDLFNGVIVELFIWLL